LAAFEVAGRVSGHGIKPYSHSPATAVAATFKDCGNLCDVCDC